jgi:hypothetical protein
MPIDISQALSQLAGVLVGGGITFAGGHIGRKQQRQDALAAERRARELAASSRAAEAAHTLWSLDEPSLQLMVEREEQSQEGLDTAELDTKLTEAGRFVMHEEWAKERNALVLTFEMAVMDIGDQQVRNRLDACAMALRQSALVYLDPDHLAQGADELRVRLDACEHAIACIGAFRRGDPLPPVSGGLAGGLLERNMELQELRESLAASPPGAQHPATGPSH